MSEEYPRLTAGDLPGLVTRLAEIVASQQPVPIDDGTPATDHEEADGALLDYIGNEEVTALFHKIYKWYA